MRTPCPTCKGNGQLAYDTFDPVSDPRCLRPVKKRRDVCWRCGGNNHPTY